MIVRKGAEDSRVMFDSNYGTDKRQLSIKTTGTLRKDEDDANENVVWILFPVIVVLIGKCLSTLRE